MVNDTSTLNGALTELGELMADNLVTMGVSDADASDGLTTLANKILDVPQAPSYDAIELTSDKSIISAYDGESAILTAQLKENGSDAHISGVSLSFVIKKGSTVIDTKTATTGADGSCSVSYVGEGAGDLNIQVSDGIIFSETYSIEDCINYDSLTSNSGKWTIPSGVTSVYNNTGWKVTANAYKQIKLTEKLTSACSVEFTLVDHSTPTSSYAPVIIYAYTNGETTPNQSILQNYSTYIDVVGTRLNQSLVKGAVYKIEYTSSTISVYENGTLLATANNNVGLPTRFEFHMGANSRYAIYKDLKVKPL